MSSRYALDLAKLQVAILEAEVMAQTALQYSCIPGATKKETGQDAVEKGVVRSLEYARQLVTGFIAMVDASAIERGVNRG